MDLTVVIPTHNPHLGRLRATLAGLRAQTLPGAHWETLLIDNASSTFPSTDEWTDVSPANLRVIREPRLGLTMARQCGFQAAAGRIAILVDDDNVLAPDYLEQVLQFFQQHPRVGVVGGKSLPQFETTPATWAEEFFPLLALRDLGPEEKVSAGLRPPGAAHNHYPDFAPIGAGMAIRREASNAWLENQAAGKTALSDRRGRELTSSGDNDIVLCAMRAGWEAAYSPRLALKHLIPPGRLTPDYLARLNRGIQKSWMQVLTAHDANSWPPLSAFSARLRKLKAWFTYRAWSSSAARIRWQGACGHFDGRVRA
jgi:glycosyltransferase involved in cell wall biosynthesis